MGALVIDRAQKGTTHVSSIVFFLLGGGGGLGGGGCRLVRGWGLGRCVGK